MGKVEKKKKKIQERIEILQEELTMALTKKTSSTAEISVGEFQRRIFELRKQLETM